MDMLVNLYRLPERSEIKDVRIQRVLAPDAGRVLAFIEKTFSPGWTAESRNALYAQPCRCFIAQKGGECVGFACYDSTALGYYGPLGVAKKARKLGIGSGPPLKKFPRSFFIGGCLKYAACRSSA